MGKYCSKVLSFFRFRLGVSDARCGFCRRWELSLFPWCCSGSPFFAKVAFSSIRSFFLVSWATWLWTCKLFSANFSVIGLEGPKLWSMWNGEIYMFLNEIISIWRILFYHGFYKWKSVPEYLIYGIYSLYIIQVLSTFWKPQRPKIKEKQCLVDCCFLRPNHTTQW